MNLKEWLLKGKPEVSEDEANRIVAESIGLHVEHNYAELYRQWRGFPNERFLDVCFHCVDCDGEIIHQKFTKESDLKIPSGYADVPDYHTWEFAGPLLERMANRTQWCKDCHLFKVKDGCGLGDCEINPERIVWAYLQMLNLNLIWR